MVITSTTLRIVIVKTDLLSRLVYLFIYTAGRDKQITLII